MGKRRVYMFPGCCENKMYWFLRVLCRVFTKKNWQGVETPELAICNHGLTVG